MNAPTYDPALNAVTRMFRSREGLEQSDLRAGRDRVNAPNPDTLDRVAAELNSLKASINGATIAATCNGDGTITVTWTPG